MLDEISKIENKTIFKTYRESRIGDVKHSLADISKAKSLLDYNPIFTFREGLKKTYKYYKINQ